MLLQEAHIQYGVVDTTTLQQVEPSLAGGVAFSYPSEIYIKFRLDVILWDTL